jgi:hypothetical protein
MKGGKRLKENHEEQKCEIDPNEKMGIHKQSVKEEIMSVKVDYSSIPRSYRDYLDLMVREGEYLAIDEEVDWESAVGRTRPCRPRRFSTKSRTARDSAPPNGALPRAVRPAGRGHGSHPS